MGVIPANSRGEDVGLLRTYMLLLEVVPGHASEISRLAYKSNSPPRHSQVTVKVPKKSVHTGRSTQHAAQSQREKRVTMGCPTATLSKSPADESALPAPPAHSSASV